MFYDSIAQRQICFPVSLLEIEPEPDKYRYHVMNTIRHEINDLLEKLNVVSEPTFSWESYCTLDPKMEVIYGHKKYRSDSK